jgi:hypothetical protein
MGVTIKSKPLDLNRLWEKTPTVLKYIFLIVVLLGALYFLFSRRIDVSHLKQLSKIEEGIETTYELVDEFESFTKFQIEYNEQLIRDIKNVYVLVNELSDNINKKIYYLIENSRNNDLELLEKMSLLNDSFNKLSKAYQPQKNITEPQISVKKIENED